MLRGGEGRPKSRLELRKGGCVNLQTSGSKIPEILLTYFMKARYLRHLSMREDLKLNGETEGEGGGSYSVIDPRAAERGERNYEEGRKCC